MAGRRMNVLVYAGTGATIESVRHCTYSLRRLLTPNYAVITVNGTVIVKEPWTASCALLVFPGGADLGYCRNLNGEGNRRIKQYVRQGGSYLGFCAGGYYGSRRCEFEVGDKKMEVIGDRELSFYPGICRGSAFAGFVYSSEAGARAARLRADTGRELEDFCSYYNGGGAFVDASRFQDDGVEVLASYVEELDVDSGKDKAAVVLCQVGEGYALLTGPHPEFAPENLKRNAHSPSYENVVDSISADNRRRVDFLKVCLQKLGLQVNQEEAEIPSLSHLHLSAQRPSDVAELLSEWGEIIVKRGDEEYIHGENDSFYLENPARWSFSKLTEALSSAVISALPHKSNPEPLKEDEDILDYDKAVKRLVSHESDLPSGKDTPCFNHRLYFANLDQYYNTLKDPDRHFGKYLLYGEVVTSTNTLLEKNPSLLSHLPSGFTASATTQIAGRGRGSNSWVSPPGALIFSTVIRHSLLLSQSAPVVFVQYLAALAIVVGIRTYDSGYEDLPVRLKWPNDVYALDPGAEAEHVADQSAGYVKIGGILVNSSYSGGDYTLVVGIGMNVANLAPTTSLDALAAKEQLAPFQIEKLLARILTCFEAIYNKFCRNGWDRSIEDEYYNNWLHTDQIVVLETEGGARARIKGITRDWGMLLAEELGWQDRSTGKVWQLQSDSNSFDFFKGLVKRKV
ncbi:biotin-protein ligase [Lineolata rhizophorae]|uniref:Biotin-protein ligase n=1 Tax=Lineolata rhizophorae TaxID=578093 RepID=A0A6A6NNC2_9PEZI|nr:biotin-protein ligase [Lineolata rhizophorae]